MTTTPNSFGALKATEQARRRRRRLIAAVVSGVVLLLVGVAIWAFWFSPLLVVKRVEVSGESLLSKDDVVTAAGVASGLPLVRVDLGAVEARVGSLNPVASVAASRSFPDAIVVEIVERELVFVRKSSEGYVWVDEDGVEFHTDAKAPKGVPVAQLGDAETRLLRDIATVVSHLPDALDGQQITMKNPSIDKIVLTLPEDREVVWGSADDSSLKADVLAALLSVEARVYDVSAPNHPTTK